MEEQQQKATILAVDDSRVMLVAATKALKKDFEVLKASNGQEAWEVIQQHPEIAVVFSDLSMPEMNGYELLDAIRGSDNPQIAKLPVVILTGQEDDDGTKEKVMESGATDFLTKPFESLDLVSRAKSLSTLSKQVTELEKKVSLDKLTRLYTENSLNDSGERSLAQAARHGSPVSLVRFDIDNFSDLFVKNGKQMAEAILVKVSEIVRSMIRQEDIAARIGVSKFTLLLPETDHQGAEKVTSRLQQLISAQQFDGVEKLSLSIGVAAPGLDKKSSLEELKSDAEQAIERAIAKGGAQIQFAPSEHKQDESAAKKGPRIDLSAVLREIDKNGGQRLGEKQINAALNSVLPLLSFLEDKMSLGIKEVIAKLEQKVDK